MKGVDIFCATQAATSICLSMQEASSSSSSVIQLGGDSISICRLIDRYNPIIRDSRITCGSGRNRPLPPHSSNQLPISPKPKNINKKSNTSSKPSKETKKRQNDHNGHVGKRKSSWSCTKPSEFITPPSSSRYLLSEKDLVDVLSDYNHDPVLNSKSCHQAVKVVANESSPPKPPSSSSPSGDQVVVLRVSLHCKGCEKKMRKHLSRMEGVTSFTIDFVAKKVTVTGNVTPLEVLASISKVKNAQLWPPTVASSVPSTKADLINSELKNAKQLVVSDRKLENHSQNPPVIQLL
ncbi:PREDICTED: protein SODIUM POTASSIUM ROOT DEFECTIVE 3-like [Nicotiana attenuata]|uniref:Copper transport protein cch n=1 Tax=Nicotiana attenuata TaxID=49451 RepID=A0A1J6IW88_NICAT|nr:PREDICTED: protein SODIUM POTASSIUM ROOT DEFECTIVE 3-like [Nicotiana attenuata]OIT01983.1 copper transport protein cch [Nicotiana attenuata]